MALTTKILCALVSLAATQLVYAQFTPTDTGRTCKAGEYDNGNICLPCPEDTISVKPGSFHCTPCPKGTISDFRSKRCITCGPGFYATGTFGCDRCPHNSFTTKMNARKCTECPPGSPNSRAESLKDCRPCPKGHFHNFDRYSISCEVCPNGSYQPNTGTTSCIPCPVGTTSKLNARWMGFPKSIDRCYQCSPGSFSTDVYYEPLKGGPKRIAQRICSKCPEGHYSPSKGSKKCLKCPAGSIPDNTRSRCIPNCTTPEKCPSCPAGTQPKLVGAPQPKNACVKCPEGRVNIGDSTTECALCPSDLVANADRTACVCPPPFVLFPKALPYENEQACFPCPRGSVRADAETCRCAKGRQWYTRFHGLEHFSMGQCRCKPFEMERDGECFRCSVKKLERLRGRFGDVPFDACNNCPHGEVFNETRGTCERCPAGYTSVASLGICEKCSDATEGFPGCPCKPGTALFRGIIGRCTRCFPGHYANPVSSTLGCSPCPIGTFGNEYGMETCKPCRPGRDYRLGQTSGADGKRCPPRCGENSELVQGLRDKFCQCKPGFIEDGDTKNVVNCKKCPGDLEVIMGKCRCLPGYLRSGTKCKICPAGTETLAKKCAPCRVNFIAPTSGTERCTECKAGSYWIGIGGTKCVTCPEGQFVNKKGKCNSCKPGFRVRNGICVACVDSVSDGGAVAFCRSCEEGKKPGPDGRICV